MATDNKTTYAVNDRLSKPNASWRTLRATFITNAKISNKPRLLLFHFLIGSILLYILYFQDMANANISQLQIFYSRRIRDIMYWIRKYGPAKQRDANETIRIKNNTHAILSKILKNKRIPKSAHNNANCIHGWQEPYRRRNSRIPQVPSATANPNTKQSSFTNRIVSAL